MATLNTLTLKVGITGTNLESFDFECGNPTLCSLECGKGDIFIAVRGTRYDGHDFIPVAASNGAGLIVCERVTPYLTEHPEIPYITVENSRLASAHIFNELCGRPGERLLLVAVTGTNGKTSTTYFLREIFRRAGYKTGVIGTVRCMIGDRCEVISESPDSGVNSMTTPSPEKLYPMLKRMADEGVEAVFMEASSHALAQHRLDPLRFAVGVFTGLTQDHLDYHGNMDEYYAAKKRLFSLCNSAVINADDAFAARLIAETDIPKFTYSAGGRNASYRAEECASDSACGISYTCIGSDDSNLRISCRVAGGFTVANTLAAVTVSKLFSVRSEVIADALRECPQIPGRLERVTLPEHCDFSVFIDYAHTPDALENVLRTMHSFVSGKSRLVVVFGCGGDRDKNKRPIMCRIATTLADVTVITGDNSRTENPRAIICDILRGAAEGADCRVIERREAAIRYVIENHREGDVILLAGKGHEDYEIDVNGKHPFSETEIVLRTVKQLEKRR